MSLLLTSLLAVIALVVELIHTVFEDKLLI